MKKIFILLTIIFLCLTSSCTKKEDYIIKTYKESNQTISSPGVGFYNTSYISFNKTGIYPNNLGSYYLSYNNLIHLRLFLGNYSSNNSVGGDEDISNTDLNEFDNLLKLLKENSVSCIIRFAYTFEADANKEPSLEQILRHIEQFVPILNKYKDTISAVECGLIGPWGEMHTSVLSTQETYNIIFDKYLNTLDKDIHLLVRRPEYIYKYYGYSLDNLNEFDYKNNRLGLYNDGYLGSSTDLGTYKDREKETDFLSIINKKFPYGGEVTVPSSQYNELEVSVLEMFKLGLSYLNEEWNDEVVQRWKTDDYKLDDKLYKGLKEFDYINNHLGYRFVLENTKYKIKNNQLDISFNIKNVGFGNLTKNKNAYLILKNDTNSYRYEINNININTIKFNIPLKNINNGTYDIYLEISNGLLNEMSLYSIPLFNDIYDDKLKSNLVLQNIKI